MSVVFSGTNQGVFTQPSTAVAQIIKVREGFDWLKVYNQTQIAAGSASTGYEFYWQLGMAAGTGIEYKSNAGSTAVNTVWMTSGGFTIVDNTINNPGPSIAITSITNAQPPVVATGNTAGLSNGDTVRIFNVTGALELGAMDFTVGAIVANTSFTLAYMQAIAAGTTGTYRRIPYDPYFYPPQRVISNVTAGTLNGFPVAIITMTVTHNFTIGQRVRLLFPTVTAAAFGMDALNLVECSVLATGANDSNSVTNTITVDVDVTSFITSGVTTSFHWPLTTDGAFTPAQVVPVGEKTAVANFGGYIGTGPIFTGPVNPFEDAEINQGYIGMLLPAGANSPGGQAGDVIYWVAGKSFNGF